MRIGEITLLINNFYGQDIPHFHWRIIPRFEGDQLNFKTNPKISIYNKQQVFFHQIIKKKVKTKLKEKLQNQRLNKIKYVLYF